jgi:hypothetical protein
MPESSSLSSETSYVLFVKSIVSSHKCAKYIDLSLPFTFHTCSIFTPHTRYIDYTVLFLFEITELSAHTTSLFLPGAATYGQTILRSLERKIHGLTFWNVPSYWAREFLFVYRINWWGWTTMYRYAPQNDVSVNDGPHIWRWSHKIIILYYNAHHCVTVAYSIQ